jgi:hypothetical protein
MLGRIDAICSFSNLAVCRLLSELAHVDNPSLKLGKFAAKYGLVIDHVDKDIMPNRLALMYILAVYSQLLEFLESFILEHPNSNKWKRITCEHIIKFVLRSIGALNNSYCEFEREIVDYYRLVRNRFMHPDVNIIHLNKQLKKIKKLIAHSDERLEPNSYYSVNFSDFDLFTRTVKSLAEKLCIIARPADDHIIAMAMNQGFKKLNKYKNKPNRYRNALSQKFCMEYCLQGKELNEIVFKYMGC